MPTKRSKRNPVLTPNKDIAWESEAVFNGSPAEKDGKIYLLYRAVSLPHYHAIAGTRLAVSDIGIAESHDGEIFHERKKFIFPEHSWERFGCEDPRVTKFEGRYYVFYTAMSSYPFGPDGIKVGLAISDDLKTIAKKSLVTPFNAKAMVMFPERINGKIWAILSVNTDKPPAHICTVNFENEHELLSEDYWNKWYKNLPEHILKIEHRPMDHIEVGAVPIKTEHGWLLFYSYIRNYFSGKPLFTVEAILLDLNDPTQIIAKTRKPVLVPEEYYEKYGEVPNVVFPSGALIKDDTIYLYYGASDTTCCLAHIPLTRFLKKMLVTDHHLFKFERSDENPILEPLKEHMWESKAIFNPAAIYLDGKVHILYRAMSDDNTSTIGYATSTDGIHIDYRHPLPIYTPRETFEHKLIPNGNSGCEDPRATVFGDRIYMLYTAYNGRIPPGVAFTSISVKDFLDKNWNWTKPVVISPDGMDDKDAGLFPEKINGKYVIIHRLNLDMDLSFHDDLDFTKGQKLEEHRWVRTRKGMWDSVKVGLSAPPIRIKEGWLVIYHGVSEDGIYRVGAILCDHNDPTKILNRTEEPIFEPETKYEKDGIVNNVVFPCSAVVIKDILYIYYGGADTVLGVATIPLEKIIKIYERES